MSIKHRCDLFGVVIGSGFNPYKYAALIDPRLINLRSVFGYARADERSRHAARDCARPRARQRRSEWPRHDQTESGYYRAGADGCDPRNDRPGASANRAAVPCSFGRLRPLKMSWSS